MESSSHIEQTLYFGVCPHDLLNQLELWFAFAAQLSRLCGVSLRFEPSLDFPEFSRQLANYHLVYANPNDTLTLVRMHGYIPLARFEESFDEGVLVVRAGENRVLAEVNQWRVATCTSLVVNDIVLRHLAKEGYMPKEMLDFPSWSAALSALVHGESDAAILYADFFNQLRSETKARLDVLAASNERLAFHSFCLAPALSNLEPVLRQALVALSHDPVGRDVLRDLGRQAIVRTVVEEIEAFDRL
ncbi:MAG: phosphate/phosphite/phosphonate ABC transporter substrate-binding protein [Thermoanaerobaculum sp.]|nr:phosphate/phosphite/phosphonate ABC transporter substrate-binding protein [Thermoanaerobaculum sp.]MDW7967296.1 PhnD/SsuA/transferrin family substrate-binding protein [Thermoanaerobaculum sp.]